MIIPVIRAGEIADLPAIAAIQQASPEAARWSVATYLQSGLRVAVHQDRVAGFLVFRYLGHHPEDPESEREWEILNLAVSPDLRRSGIGRALVHAFLSGLRGVVFLEVRASNSGARNLYKSLGFQELGLRPGYYEEPAEPAIVMKFHSC